MDLESRMFHHRKAQSTVIFGTCRLCNHAGAKNFNTVTGNMKVFILHLPVAAIQKQYLNHKKFYVVLVNLLIWGSANYNKILQAPFNARPSDSSTQLIRAYRRYAAQFFSRLLPVLSNEKEYGNFKTRLRRGRKNSDDTILLLPAVLLPLKFLIHPSGISPLCQ